MPPEDRFRHSGRRWWRDHLREQQAARGVSEQDLREHLEHFRPPWWPENEPWPPVRRHWPRRMRRSFMRPLGCAFLLFSLLFAAVVVTAVLLALNALGLTPAAIRQAGWIAPLAGVALAGLLSAMVIAALAIRRMSMPLDELLAASHRVADGDYSARVAPRGPAEVRSLAAAFNAMAEQLEAHDQQRRSMLADVTHELRTPLTVIQGNLEGMLDGVYAADEAHLRSILDEIHVLSRLTDDLRTLSQAESGALDLKREPTDFIALARNTMSAHRSQADASGVELRLVATQPELLCDVDPERIRQVLSNLLSNAVRYSPPGGAVQLDVSRAGNSITVSVADSGLGIPADDLPHVFDRYYKSADSRGMGLGLAIARYLVEAHGGEIQAKSSPGSGTTISFTLPA